jgi:uncharacterized membrane protein
VGGGISGLLTQLLSWKALLAAAAVFGFAPGAALRLIVLAFPRSDPRRRELLAELRAVPRLERPVWVAEQLEVALAEGVAGRLARAWRRAAPGRRAARAWRREKDEFLDARYTVGYSLTSFVYVVGFVYIAVLAPGIAKAVACIPWLALGLVMARIHEQAKKRLPPGEPLPASELDRKVFIVAGPAVCAATVYLLVHDVIELASGHASSPGYWAGTCLCLLMPVTPLEMIRMSVRPGAAASGPGQPAES